MGRVPHCGGADGGKGFAIPRRGAFPPCKFHSPLYRWRPFNIEGENEMTDDSEGSNGRDSGKTNNTDEDLPDIYRHVRPGGDDANAVRALRKVVGDFIARRRWEPYHNPKDLAISVIIEAAELLELTQWQEGTKENLTSDPDFLPRVKEELADVIIYCLSLANVLDLDVTEIVVDKVKRNEKKYPPEDCDPWESRE